MLKLDIDRLPNTPAMSVMISRIGLITYNGYASIGKINDAKDSTNVIVKQMVNIGIITTLANIDITFRFSKKYAMITTSASIVAILIDMLSASHFGDLIRSIRDLIGLYNIAMPITHEKLIKKLISYTDSGLIKKQIIPANDIADKVSYRLKNIGAIISTTDIMPALTIDVANPHMYA